MTLERIDSLRARLRNQACRRSVNPRDVDVLLADVTGHSLPFLLAHGEEEIDSSPFDALLSRRFAGEPLQYIRQKTEFLSREIYVDERVLIPRPETEIVVETALERAPAGSRVVDVGTGSGCIAISLERTRPDLRVTGVDVSLAALAVAEKNRKALGSNIALVASDLLGSLRGTFDVVVSNPPYIPADEHAALGAEVRDYEPAFALTPGPRGTETIERLLDQVGNALLISEIGYGQIAALRAIAAAKGFGIHAVVPDLAGIARVVVLSRHGQ